MASGVPVLGYRAGGLPEVVTDGETGCLREVGDIDGLARAGIGLLQNPAQWRTMSVAAMSDARRRFSLDRVVAQYESMYERTLVAPAAK